MKIEAPDCVLITDSRKGKLNRALLTLIFLTSFLASCSPTYRVQTELTPPKDERGLECVKTCTADFEQCKGKALNRYQICQSRVSIDRTLSHRRCFSRRSGRSSYLCNRGLGFYGTGLYHGYCSYEGSHCKDSFEICFVHCGGKLSYEKSCISRCPS